MFVNLFYTFVAGRWAPSRARKWALVGNELSEETHVLTKQEILLGKGTRVESSRVREPRRTALSHGLQSLFGFYGDGISFRVVFGQSF